MRPRAALKISDCSEPVPLWITTRLVSHRARLSISRTEDVLTHLRQYVHNTLETYEHSTNEQ